MRLAMRLERLSPRLWVFTTGPRGPVWRVSGVASFGPAADVVGRSAYDVKGDKMRVVYVGKDRDVLRPARGQ